jgi:hypothetical protein
MISFVFVPSWSSKTRESIDDANVRIPMAARSAVSIHRCVTHCVTETVLTIRAIHIIDKRTPPDVGACAGYSCHSQYSLPPWSRLLESGTLWLRPYP